MCSPTTTFPATISARASAVDSHSSRATSSSSSRVLGALAMLPGPIPRALPGATSGPVFVGLSIPTCLASAAWFAAQLAAPPTWLVWLATPRDAPILVLLALVVLAFGLGRLARRP